MNTKPWPKVKKLWPED